QTDRAPSRPPANQSWQFAFQADWSWWPWSLLNILTQSRSQLSGLGRLEAYPTMLPTSNFQLPTHSISNTASTSTDIPAGSEIAPTALRAATPASGPNTSRISSLKPLITAGWSVNSAVQRTRPNVFTSRTTRSSEPSSARRVARVASPVCRAALKPSSTERSIPTQPVMSVLSGFSGPCPEV